MNFQSIPSLKYFFLLWKFSLIEHNSRESLNTIKKNSSHHLHVEPCSPCPPDIPLSGFLFLRGQALGELDTESLCLCLMVASVKALNKAHSRAQVEVTLICKSGQNKLKELGPPAAQLPSDHSRTTLAQALLLRRVNTMLILDSEAPTCAAAWVPSLLPI